MSRSCRLADRDSRSTADAPVGPRKSTVRHDAATTEHLTASQHGFATELTGTMKVRATDTLRLRGVAALLAAWLGFLTLQTAVSRARWPSATGLGLVARIVVVQSVMWALLSIGVGAWHKRARALAPNVWVLLALHIPTLAAVSIIDSAISRSLSSVIRARAT